MGKAKKKRRQAPAPAGRNGIAVPPDESKDITQTRALLEPAIERGISHFRLASAAGAHPDDMKGFLEGRVTLTFELRKRLRDQLPNLLEPAIPDR
jgi:hypothetical protein